MENIIVYYYQTMPLLRSLFKNKSSKIANAVMCRQSHVQRYSWTWEGSKKVSISKNNAEYAFYIKPFYLGHFIQGGYYIYSTRVAYYSLVQQEIIT